MNRTTVNPATLPSADELRRTFETEIAKAQRAEPIKASQRPIAVRSGTLLPTGQAAEKRALTDAARALAQLWNISPSLIR